MILQIVPLIMYTTFFNNPRQARYFVNLTGIGREMVPRRGPSRYTRSMSCSTIVVEKHREGQKNIRVTFIDLEKAYDRIPREEIWRCSRERNVPEKYIRIVQDMYRGCRTVVCSAAGESNSFGVEVGLHQGSALSPYLFLLLMDVLTEDVRKDVPGSMMFADDIVLCGDDETDMTEYLETWRRALENRGMRISRPKTQFMDFKFGRDNGQGREPVKILGEDYKECIILSISVQAWRRQEA